MFKRFLCVLLTLSVLGTCVAFPAFSAESETELFADNFESYGDVGTAVPTIGANPWNSATNAIVAQDPLDSGNKVCEIFASGTQYWPSLHKTVAMHVDEATVFTGRVMLHPTASVPDPSFYLEYRNSVGNDAANREQVFHITPASIRGVDKSDDFGDIEPDTWVSYKVEIIPGDQNEETEINVTVTGDGLTNSDGEKVSEITFTDRKVMDNIAIYANNAANMVHNTNINEPGDTKQAKIYLDDVRIYAPPMLSRNADLASLTYGDGNTSVNGFEPDIVEYRVSLDVGTEAVSLSAVPSDPEASVEYSTDELTEFPGSITATVTAPYGNQKQYVVNFRIKSSESEVESQILKVKNGAAGIVTLTYDDGDISTAEFNADMFEKYDLYGTNFLIGRNLTSSVLPRMQAVVERGRIDVASHGMYHDGGVYNPDSTEQYYQEEIVDSKTMFENAFPSLDIIVFGPGDGRITERGLELVKENYYAQRKGTRGFGSVEPDEDELWDAYVKGIHDDTTLEGRNGWVDTAIENGQWLIELWHSIDAPGYMPQTKADAEAHYSYISQKQKEGKIWVASYTQAVKYMREKKVSESVATLVGDAVEVSLTYPDTALPTDIFDYPLTVKVEVPSDWGSAQVSQNGQTKLVSTYTEDGKTWANADIVPNGEIAALTEGVTGGKLESIMINGAAISGFNPDQLSYTVQILDADLPVTVSAKALDSGAEVTYAPSATVSATPATVTINVKDSDGVQQQYTVAFTKELSSNNKLASLSVNGTSLSSFSPDLTDYLVKTDMADDGVTLAAAAEDPTAKIVYSANNITTLPQDVTITVTAENGAEKVYTLKLSDRNADTVFADDDFESYTVGVNITQETWLTNNGTTNGVMGAADPFDETNQVGKMYNLTGGVQNQQMNRYLDGINTEPVIRSGREMRLSPLPAVSPLR